MFYDGVLILYHLILQVISYFFIALMCLLSNYKLINYRMYIIKNITINGLITCICKTIQINLNHAFMKTSGIC